MKNLKSYYAIRGFINTGDTSHEEITSIQKIARLARKHRAVCEWVCNGRKWNADRGPEYTQEMFDNDIEKIKSKIFKAGLPENKYAIDFQNDPRGATVKLYLRNANNSILGLRDITEVLYL